MNTFVLHLFAADRYECIGDAVSFVGEDGSGSFGLLARHERFMTVLKFGLGRVLRARGDTEYLGIPGGLLYFKDNELRLSTRRYLRDTDLGNLTAALNRELLEEERNMEEIRRKLHRLEAEMVRHLAHLEAK